MTDTVNIVGQLVIDIPKFQLDGNQSISLSTTAGTYSLTGNALATSTISCTGGGATYGKIYFSKKDA